MLELSLKKERANRGKYAEGEVRKLLEKRNAAVAGFDYERNYDARSSMGRIPARAGDYTFFEPGRHGVIEAKEVDHAHLLPKKNFDPKKFGKLRKRQLAGGDVLVVVYFRKIEQWRTAPFNWFFERREQPSWDMREFPLRSNAATALAAAGL